MAIYLNNVGGNIELVSGNAPARIYYGGGGTSGNFKPADVSRAGELNGFLIDLGGDSYSFKFDDLVINGYYPTTLEFASEALQALFSQTPYTPPPLRLQYDDAINVPFTTLGEWNEFFGLPDKGLPFTSLQTEGKYVYLRGGKGITLKETLFKGNSSIIGFIDEACCIVSAENQVFGLCSYLQELSMPLLKTAGEKCFNDCVRIPFIDKLPSLITAGNSCFSGCTSATSFDLPSLQDAGERCFYSCTSATKLKLPLLQNAGIGCFASCSSELEFDLPLLITAGNSCFGGCTSATSFNLPLLQSAGDSCFGECTNTTYFILPSLQTAGDGCFEYCSSATLFNLSSMKNLGKNVEDNGVFFEIIGNTISLTIPSALMTCNAGEPDGDITYLQDNNDVTITLV